jgi:hypothetical protein
MKDADQSTPFDSTLFTWIVLAGARLRSDDLEAEIKTILYPQTSTHIAEEPPQ